MRRHRLAAFSVVVEMLNIRIRGGRKPVQLKKKEV